MYKWRIIEVHPAFKRLLILEAATKTKDRSPSSTTSPVDRSQTRRRALVARSRQAKTTQPKQPSPPFPASASRSMPTEPHRSMPAHAASTWQRLYDLRMLVPGNVAPGFNERQEAGHLHLLPLLLPQIVTSDRLSDSLARSLPLPIERLHGCALHFARPLVLVFEHAEVPFRPENPENVRGQPREQSQLPLSACEMAEHLA